ncbi:MAG: 2,3-bisphosphoglycerate-independent phosphoglycerate mutase [Acidocella sp.]|nr:2,3-bisphosphoglycerate-independent phosphoglycerate mutase [Acidocella sp.]
MKDQIMPKPVMLVILDGFGWREERADNAVALAATPNFDRLWQTSPHAFLTTCGLVVGLPQGQMGNSEVGHLNIGAGRVVMQELPRIDAAIKDGSLARNTELLAFIARLKESGGVAHLMGLVSPGGVHAHQDQGLALAAMLHAQGVGVVVHAWMDGRDTPPQAGDGYMRDFVVRLGAHGRIGSVIGRYYAMDRDHRWERVAQAFRLIVDGEGTPFESAEAAIAASYAAGVGDEFIPPAVIGGYGGVRPGDGVLCFNYRADRVREILAALLDPAFAGFARPVPGFAAALGMTAYAEALAPLMHHLFAPQHLGEILGEVVAAHGKAQLRMAETEKYPHVTYFMNGGREAPYAGEDRIMVPSPKVATYDLQPEMSAPALTEAAVEAIERGVYDLIILNFANPDMVGHTGVLAAAMRAVEAVDAGLGAIAAAVVAQGGALLVTADHGNCELMRDAETGGPHTAHTLNPVPVLLAGGPAGAVLHDGILADLAPTLLALLQIPQPGAMTGRTLIR